MLEKILLVGHCVPDTFMLKSKMRQLFPDATVDNCNSQSDMEAKMSEKSLLLVNRVLDGSFAAAGGIELIEQHAKSDDSPKLMLISNFNESQEQAIAVGAMLGFGKSELGSEATEEKLKKVMHGH